MAKTTDNAVEIAKLRADREKIAVDMNAMLAKKQALSKKINELESAGPKKHTRAGVNLRIEKAK